ncbi:MAG TPA: YggS family pyridoxal phosphate-dependent enzyme [Cyclobacteriaceae bacterium]|nr:YggS family pyridoxal phosphate-dependent enzyme [Cyclobacteriaceae bacterium]
MGIKNNIVKFRDAAMAAGARLIAVTKTHPVDRIQEAYDTGQRIFGENKVQELTEKQPQLPADIEWHLLGHLQRNKVKYIAPFISLIQSVDSLRLLEEIEKQAGKNKRTIDCLLQVYIAKEETKFGLSPDELMEVIQSAEFKSMQHIRVVGLMGIATLTGDSHQIRQEFRNLKALFEKIKSMNLPGPLFLRELSMGMSADYTIALEEGSTLIRIGTAIFGDRNYAAV